MLLPKPHISSTIASEIHLVYLYVANTAGQQYVWTDTQSTSQEGVKYRLASFVCQIFHTVGVKTGPCGNQPFVMSRDAPILHCGTNTLILSSCSIRMKDVYLKMSEAWRTIQGAAKTNSSFLWFKRHPAKWLVVDFCIALSHIRLLTTTFHIDTLILNKTESASCGSVC